METIRKTESKIGKNDEPSHIPMQMPKPQASSTRLNNKNPSSFKEGTKSNKSLEQELIRDRIYYNRWKKHQLRLEISSKLTPFLEKYLW